MGFSNDKIVFNSNCSIEAPDSVDLEIRCNDDLRFHSQGGYYQFVSMRTGTGTNVVIDGSGWLRQDTSSRRYKKDITSIELETSDVYKLRPVSFSWKEDNNKESDKQSKSRDFGLIAEEVNEILPDLVIKDSEGKPQSVKYDRISVLLIQELKKQKEKNDNQEKTIQDLLKRIEVLENKI